MFSPDASFHGVHGALSRNPRRRQRHDSDSAKNQPDRKRSKISDASFLEPVSPAVNGNGSSGLNGHTVNGDEKRRSALRHEIPVREKHSAAPARSIKGDGSTILTKSPNYTFKQLPSLPDPLRSNPHEDYRAFVLPATRYAVAFTREHAFVWDYTTPVPTPSSSRTLSLPYPLKRSDPLPVGSLVNTGPSGDLGLIVVHPISGKIKFWENVDSAESLSLFQQRRQGIEGSVGSLLSGETVVDIVNAEHAGFVLVFSTGRLAQLTVRDSQGRPHISVQFLRSQSQNNSSSFFGNLSSFFSGSGWNKDVTAVKVRPSQLKGQLEVVVATGSGSFQVWDLNWAGQHALKEEINAQQELLASFEAGVIPEMRGNGTSARVLDFTITDGLKPQSSEDSLIATPSSIGLLALVALSGPARTTYGIVEVELIGCSAKVSRMIALDKFAGSPAQQAPDSGKLLVPAPGHTAFAVFSNAVVITSLLEPSDSPDTQLMVDVGTAPKPFQDVIYFRRERNLRFVGYALEESARKTKQSSCMIFTRGLGAIRVSAASPSLDGKDPERARATAKSRITQAVWFGSAPDSIFDFSAKPEFTFENQEVEAAALQISQEILDSSSEHIPVGLASQSQQLALRAGALAHLARHLKENYPPLSRVVKWQLLWNAEKLASAHGVWDYYEERLKMKTPHAPLLDEIVDMLHERHKSELRPELGELDPIRQWFVKDVSKMHIMIPWAQLSVREVYKEGVKDYRTLILLVSEADDICLNALEKAFSFRRDHLFEYGLESEELDYNILTTGYEGLPLPWTSTPNIVNAIRALVDLAREMVWQISEQEGELPFSKKVAGDNPRLVKLCCQVHMERYRWCLAQSDDKTRATGQALKQEFENHVRHNQVTSLAKIGMAESGMIIAERFKDMKTLVSLVWDELHFLGEERDNTDNEEEERHFANSLKKLENRIRSYFDRFGQAWADALYNSHVHLNRSGMMLDRRDVGQDLLTRFLRSRPAFAKISWINDVLGENDFVTASQALMHVGMKQETRDWSKKVEMSLAKLSLLAAEADGKTEHIDKPEARRALCDSELRLLELQEKVYKHIKPTIDGALDDDSAIDLVMMDYGTLFVKDRPALQQLLKRGFEEIIAHRALDAGLLIDVLTLMDHAQHESGPQDISGRQNFMAFEALAASEGILDKVTWEGSLKLAWKRTFLCDDWEAINNTVQQADAQVRLALENTLVCWTLKQGYQSGLWDKHPSLRHLSPSEVLDAGCRAEELQSRFPSEDLRDPIIKDNIKDDDDLQGFLSACRLDYWYAEIKELAKTQAFSDAELDVQRAGLSMQVVQEDRDVTPRATGRVNGIMGTVEEEPEAEEAAAVEDSDAVLQSAGGFEGDDEQSELEGEPMEE
ncbi:Non-repetitive/WGA-negative nucleoporin C-terminal-domain-containing protein [Macrophomina phaseolina]|uniref:Non-repetitive/WGA-negative nucleoporin C-terminal-domain-containing protein n=1 Tax=Macrophomina phaseolina TaxID=35725 RepID=A0ABQ8GNQ4_9PEZI|nr:Non-repetitive/WGA-negative nucleoporin C-terminal-domain-containing protein [Macrophomina phaseolina]